MLTNQRPVILKELTNQRPVFTWRLEEADDDWTVSWDVFTVSSFTGSLDSELLILSLTLLKLLSRDSLVMTPPVISISTPELLSEESHVIMIYRVFHNNLLKIRAYCS